MLGAVSLTKLFTAMVDGFKKRPSTVAGIAPQTPHLEPSDGIHGSPLVHDAHVVLDLPAVHLSTGTLIQTFPFYRSLPSAPRSSC